MRIRVYIVLLLLAALLAAEGCAPSLVARRTSVTSSPAHPRLAVIPFDNLSGKEAAGVKITTYFQSLMTGNAKFDLVEYGEAYDILRKFRIRSSRLLTASQIDTLAQYLKIDYIVTGSVYDYSEFDNTYLGKVPQVSFDTRVIECATQKTVWVGVSNGRGDESEIAFGIGAVRSADELAKRMVGSAVSDIAGLFK
jgi:TolB-like protein